MISIKQLKSGNKVFFPQTIAEAVVVQDEYGVNTLEQVLHRKIENISTTEELTVTNENNSTKITHTNEITANDNLEPLLIQHDSKGHIINAKPHNKLYVMVGGTTYTSYSGAQDSEINFGDDFQIQEDNITLRWNNI